MFTGIIEFTGTIQAIHRAGLRIACGCPGLQIGESIAVNGVCLTVTAAGSGAFTCDLSPETTARTTFEKARPGALVNLERPLQASSRLGGHFVQGHVDGVGALMSRTPAGEGAELRFRFPAELARYIVPKGSIAVDGISLTVAALDTASFMVAVIPHTLRTTTLGALKPGDPVNLEADILGKYVERFLSLRQEKAHNGSEGGLTIEYLKEEGY